MEKKLVCPQILPKRNAMTPKFLGACFLLVTSISVLASAPDLDHDGIPNRFDRDVDNDGIPNSLDRNIDGGFCRKGPLKGHYIGDHMNNNSVHEHDMDGDGIVNSRDTDMDGDGIRNENDTDANGDGIEDSLESGDLTKSGSGTLTISGGTLTLDGNNTYTGATAIIAGLLDTTGVIVNNTRVTDTQTTLNTTASTGTQTIFDNTGNISSQPPLLLNNGFNGTITITSPITFEVTADMIANGTTISLSEDWTTLGGILVYLGTSYTTNADIIAAGLPVTFTPASN